jgi:DNA (cytosine-5)-methyltransferase 1
MENVPLAAASVQFKRFTNRLEHAGYSWTAGIINSALRGSPQCRLRLIFVAIRADVGVEPAFPAPNHGAAGKYFSYRFSQMRTIDSDRDCMLGIPASVYKFKERLPYWEAELGPQKIPRVGETLQGLPAIGTAKAFAASHVQWAHKPGQLRRMARVPEGGRWKGGLDHYSQSYGRLHHLGLARTITTAFPNAGSGRFWHPTENRSLTLREAARIQGFPDSFAFLTPISQAAILVGNALDSCLADVTYEIIRSCIE